MSEWGFADMEGVIEAVAIWVKDLAINRYRPRCGIKKILDFRGGGRTYMWCLHEVKIFRKVKKWIH